MRIVIASLLLMLAACTAATDTTTPAAGSGASGPGADAATGDGTADATPAGEGADAAAPATGAMPSRDAAPARLRGRVSYPSEELPAMRVCALDRGDPGRARCVGTAANQPHYELAVPAGAWWLLAWPRDAGAAGDPGLLSAASDCLGSGGTGCDDHALLAVDVAAGEVREGLDINDWYYDPGQFPPPMPPAGD